MAEFKFVANVTDRHGNPLIGLDVEAIDINLFTSANRDPMEYVADIQKTDDSGTVVFTNLPIGMYYARPRVNRDDVRIQVMTPSGMGGGGKMCYAALVQPNGVGTHTTIQSAITDLGLTGGVIYVCAGTYTEDITVAGDTANLWIIGASRAEVVIVGNWSVQAAGTGPVENYRMEHLTLNGDAGVALYFNSVAGGAPTNVGLIDLYIINATVGIDMSDVNGGTNWLIDSVDMASSVVDAGQFEVNFLDITNCRWLVAGKGPYIGGGSAIIDTKITSSSFQGGSTYCMRMLNITKLVLSGCRFLTTGAGVDGILVGTGATVTIGDSTFDLHAGNAINAGAAVLTGLTLTNLQATCVVPQTVDRIGIDIGSNVTELVIDGCRLKNFESYGIRLGAVQDFIIGDTIIINGGDTHSIYLNGADYGTISGCMLRGTGGAGTTYGVYGAAGTTNIVLVGSASPGHDGFTNLVTGVDGNLVIGNSGGGGGGGGGAPTNAPYLTFGLNFILDSEVSVKAGDAETLPADDMLLKWDEASTTRRLILQNLAANGIVSVKLNSKIVGDAIAFHVDSEAEPRVLLQYDRLKFGPGGAVAPDITINRDGANTLAFNSKFITRYTDTEAYSIRNAADVVVAKIDTTNRLLTVFTAASGSIALGAAVAGDTYNRAALVSDGSLRLGSGAATPDSIITRPAPGNMIRVEDVFGVAGAAKTLANGDNNDVAIADVSFVSVTGPTADFAITGIVPKAISGQLLFLYHLTAFNMTIRNESASSAAANRILTLTGADWVSTGPGAVIMLYSAGSSRWIVLSAWA